MSFEDQITDREFRTQGTYVEQYRKWGGVWESGSYGDRVAASSMMQARAIANALNAAYRAGKRDGVRNVREHLLDMEV